MRRPLPLVALVILGACSQGTPTAEPAPTPTVAAPRTLVAADLDPQSLGAKIEGPKGTDPEFAVHGQNGRMATVTSFVACPAAMTSCDPADLPEGTVLTYAHTITPDIEAAAAAEPSAPATSSAGTAEIPPALFRMTRAAPGFNGTVGYDKAQATAALGAQDAITVTIDEGEIIWRVTGGKGWQAGKPITVWWQSTVPPRGPQQAFALEWDGMEKPATGPFPAQQKPVERPATR